MGLVDMIFTALVVALGITIIVICVADLIKHWFREDK